MPSKSQRSGRSRRQQQKKQPKPVRNSAHGFNDGPTTRSRAKHSTQNRQNDKAPALPATSTRSSKRGRAPAASKDDQNQQNDDAPAPPALSTRSSKRKQTPAVSNGVQNQLNDDIPAPPAASTRSSKRKQAPAVSNDVQNQENDDTPAPPAPSTRSSKRKQAPAVSNEAENQQNDDGKAPPALSTQPNKRKRIPAVSNDVRNQQNDDAPALPAPSTGSSKRKRVPDASNDDQIPQNDKGKAPANAKRTKRNEESNTTPYMIDEYAVPPNQFAKPPSAAGQEAQPYPAQDFVAPVARPRTRQDWDINYNQYSRARQAARDAARATLAQEEGTAAPPTSSKLSLKDIIGKEKPVPKGSWKTVGIGRDAQRAAAAGPTAEHKALYEAMPKKFTKLDTGKPAIQYARPNTRKFTMGDVIGTRNPIPPLFSDANIQDLLAKDAQDAQNEENEEDGEEEEVSGRPVRANRVK